MIHEHDELNRLRDEVAELHKIVIDAKAILDDGTNDGELSSADPGKLHMAEQIAEALLLLDTAPEPSDETLCSIEAEDGETK